MTAAAWITLGMTWAVIGFFTVRFFLKVVTAEANDSGEPDEDPRATSRDA